MSRIDFCFIRAEHEKRFITSGPVLEALSICLCITCTGIWLWRKVDKSTCMFSAGTDQSAAACVSKWAANQNRNKTVFCSIFCCLGM